MRWMLEPARRMMSRIDSGKFDEARPLAEFDRFETAAQARLDKLPPGMGVNSFVELLKAASKDPGIVEQRMPRARLARRVCEYMCSAEPDLPYLVSILSYGSPLFSIKPLEHAGALARLKGAARGRGESRSHALRELVDHVIEAYYQEVINLLYEIECARRARRIDPKQSLGSRINLLVRDGVKTVLPELLDAEAAHLRNAAAHRHWSYSLRTERVHLHDRAWRRDFSLAELYAKQRTYGIAAVSMQKASLWALLRGLRLLSGPPCNFLLAVLNDAKIDVAVEGAKCRSHLSQLLPTFKRLRDIGWQPRNNVSLEPALLFKELGGT